MSLLPAILMAITAVSMFLFPLTNKRVAQIQAEINARKNQTIESTNNLNA